FSLDEPATASVTTLEKGDASAGISAPLLAPLPSWRRSSPARHGRKSTGSAWEKKHRPARVLLRPWRGRPPPRYGARFEAARKSKVTTMVEGLTGTGAEARKRCR